jgi:(2Fe-2S) ferredoxin
MRSEVRLVVCVNERLGSGQRSCVGSNNLEYIGKIRSMIEAENLSVPIIERICLGKCEQGPVMRIAPGGRFFTEITDARLQDIIDEIKAFLSLADKER